MRKKMLSILMATLLLMQGTTVFADNGQNYDPNEVRQQWADFINGIDKESSGNTNTVSGGRDNIINTNGQQSAQYAVKTLVGGLNSGYSDGTLDIAKIGPAADMKVDKNDNIFFLDSTKNTLRKYDAKNKEITTMLTARENTLSVKYKIGNKVKVYNGSDFKMSKLAYDPSDDSLYMAGSYDVGSTMDNMNEIFKVSPKVEICSYIKHKYSGYPYINPRIRWEDFLKVDKNNIYFSDRFGMYGDPSNIVSAVKYKEGNTIGTNKFIGNNSTTGPTLRGKTDAVITNDAIYMYNIGTKTLSKINKFPRSYEVIAEFDDIYDSVTAYNNNFYLSKGDNIYKLDLNGNLSSFINGSSLNYDTQSKISKITNMDFDKDGNIILYDVVTHRDVHGATITDNATIRKIVLK